MLPQATLIFSIFTLLQLLPTSLAHFRRISSPAKYGEIIDLDQQEFFVPLPVTTSPPAPIPIEDGLAKRSYATTTRGASPPTCTGGSYTDGSKWTIYASFSSTHFFYSDYLCQEAGGRPFAVKGSDGDYSEEILQVKIETKNGERVPKSQFSLIVSADSKTYAGIIPSQDATASLITLSLGDTTSTSDAQVWDIDHCNGHLSIESYEIYVNPSNGNIVLVKEEDTDKVPSTYEASKLSLIASEAH